MQLIDEFRQAAANAMEAGFDGVELHGANGVRQALSCSEPSPLTCSALSSLWSAACPLLPSTTFLTLSLRKSPQDETFVKTAHHLRFHCHGPIQSACNQRSVHRLGAVDARSDCPKQAGTHSSDLYQDQPAADCPLARSICMAITAVTTLHSLH